MWDLSPRVSPNHPSPALGDPTALGCSSCSFWDFFSPVESRLGSSPFPTPGRAEGFKSAPGEILGFWGAVPAWDGFPGAAVAVLSLAVSGQGTALESRPFRVLLPPFHGSGTVPKRSVTSAPGGRGQQGTRRVLSRCPHHGSAVAPCPAGPGRALPGHLGHLRVGDTRPQLRGSPGVTWGHLGSPEVT